jgi:hypothetical protein
MYTLKFMYAQYMGNFKKSTSQVVRLIKHFVIGLLLVGAPSKQHNIGINHVLKYIP